MNIFISFKQDEIYKLVGQSKLDHLFNNHVQVDHELFRP